MAAAPTRYYVEHMDTEKFGTTQDANGGNEDPRNYLVQEDFATLKGAQSRKASLNALGEHHYTAIYERTNIEDTTPASLRRRGIDWQSASFDQELVEE